MLICARLLKHIACYLYLSRNLPSAQHGWFFFLVHTAHLFSYLHDGYDYIKGKKSHFPRASSKLTEN